MRKRIKTPREVELRNIIAVAELELAKINGPEILTYVTTTRTCDNHTDLGYMYSVLNKLGIGNVLESDDSIEKAKEYRARQITNRKQMYKELYKCYREAAKADAVADSIHAKLLAKAELLNKNSRLVATDL